MSRMRDVTHVYSILWVVQTIFQSAALPGSHLLMPGPSDMFISPNQSTFSPINKCPNEDRQQL